MSTKQEKLLAQFRAVELRLSGLLDGDADRTGEIDQDTLDQVRSFYLAYGRDGTPVPVAAVVNVSLSTMKPTDLCPNGKFKQFVRAVSVHDVLSANCLHRLADQEKVGVVARREVLAQIRDNIRARIAATVYKPWTQELDDLQYNVLNSLVTLRSKWGAKDIAELFETLTANRVFEQRVHDDRLGIVFTSLTEKPDMNRQWLSDSAFIGAVQRKLSPHLWPRNMISNAGFLCTDFSIAAMLRTVDDPKWFRDGDASCGIPHIYLPVEKQSSEEGLRWDEKHKVPALDSIREDPAWFNRQRLESQALLLCWLVKTIKAGAFLDDHHPRLAALGDRWGFNWLNGRPGFPPENGPMTERQKEYVITAIQVTAMYLLAVQWNGENYDMEAPTVSSWEEAPFPGGCASDTGFMVDAMRELLDLLFEEAYDDNPTIADVRKRLESIDIHHEKLGSAAEMLAERPFADFRSKEQLEKFIFAGMRKLGEMVIKPARDIMESTSRPTAAVKQFHNGRFADSSLVVLAAWHSHFDERPSSDGLVRLGIVLACEHHLRDVYPHRAYGMRRYGAFPVETEEGIKYGFDSYLNYLFDLGLLMPGLVGPMIAEWVKTEYQTVAPHIERRMALGTANRRDLILHELYLRHVAEKEQDLEFEPKRDATSFESMLERQQFSTPEFAAQWTIGSTAAVVALARAKLGILQVIEEEGMNDRLKWMLWEVNRTLVRFINLCIATIVEHKDAEGKIVFRADGTELPACFNVLEAFQPVPDVLGTVQWLPGNHTLPWSASQLFWGLELAEIAAKRQESVLLNGNGD